MKAITLWQPWASLCVLPRPDGQMVKQFETRGWPAPASLRGQRIAIHAAVRKPRHAEVDVLNEALDPYGFAILEHDRGSWSIAQRPLGEEWCSSNTVMSPLLLGAVVGTAVVAACYPIFDLRASRSAITAEAEHMWVDSGDRRLSIYTPDRRYPSCSLRVISRTERPPWRDIIGQLPFGWYAPGRYAWELVDVERFDEPVPATGRQGIWNWELPRG